MREFEENWRYTPLKQFHLERFTPFLPFEKDSFVRPSEFLSLPLQTCGEILYGEEVSMAILDPQANKQGLYLDSLSQALQKRGDLASAYLERSLKTQDEKPYGVFCSIPENQQITSPLLIVHSFSKEKASFFPRLVVVVGQGAQATIFHTSFSEAKKDGANFIQGLYEIYLEENASLCFVDLQNLSQQTEEIAFKHFELSRSSKLNYISALNGSKLSKTNLEIALKGEGAEAQVLSLMSVKEKQHLELFSKTKHASPNTKANILVKGVVKDRGQSIFQGMIRIEKEAQKTESFMQNNNLLLSPEARATSIPRLEIEADDVKASHGSTTGEMDAEQLFYLKSRGFNEADATHLLVEGFYEDILRRIPNESVREIFKKHVENGHGSEC